MSLGTPSERAFAIARGLIRTQRSSEVEVAEGYLRLPAGQDDSYWISFDASHLLRGHWREFAEELQRGFIDAMARAGSER
jgi:hypothetical protein